MKNFLLICLTAMLFASCGNGTNSNNGAKDSSMNSTTNTTGNSDATMQQSTTSDSTKRVPDTSSSPMNDSAHH